MRILFLNCRSYDEFDGADGFQCRGVETAQASMARAYSGNDTWGRVVEVRRSLKKANSGSPAFDVQLLLDSAGVERKMDKFRGKETVFTQGPRVSSHIIKWKRFDQLSCCPVATSHRA